MQTVQRAWPKQESLLQKCPNYVTTKRLLLLWCSCKHTPCAVDLSITMFVLRH
jgi:hypothetical protein